MTGTWQTQWGADVAIVELRQEGESVQGSYRTTGAPPGMLSGSMNGDVLVGQWVDHAGGSGGFQFVFDGALQSFQGTWGSGGSLDDGGSWNGRRWQGEAAVTAAP